MTLAQGTRLGAYEVLEPIGSGGMGEVYRARDTRLGREVAVKVLPETLANDRDRLARFEQEARAASALNHPHIVTIHEIGREGEVAFIAMELVKGKTLRELAAAGPMPVRRILGVATQVAEGLAKAHTAGIVHRDLKPENVMVSKDGFAKILDFGLAKLVEPSSGGASAMPTLAHPETHPGTVLGTVGYMSPEQASGAPVDYRSDQFSLGSVLYEMATGEKPFQRKTAAETMSAIIREEPEPIARRRPDLPPPVRWIVERCLAKEPEERYASTRDLARDLAGVRDHISEVSSGVEAASPGPGRPRRRGIPLVWALALLAIGTIAGILGSGRLAKPVSRAAPTFHRLTFRRGAIANARFAPDGRTILYGSSWEGEPRATRLYMTRPESPESSRFDLPNADILAISTSGELAVLLDMRQNLGTLARLPMAGGIPRKLLEGVPYASADWSPDGKDLAVIHQVEGKQRLEYPVGKVLLEDSSSGLGSPRLSPKADRIAFWETDTLSVIDTLGKAKKKLTSGWAGGLAGAPCWRPDGEEIWFTGSEAGQTDALWAVDLSGKRRLIMRVPGGLELDDIARDGRVLVAHHTTLQSLIGLAPGETLERDLAWLDASWPSDLSADGKTLILTEAGEGSGKTPVVYSRGTDGSPAVRLGEGRGLALSPDGGWVLAVRDAGGGTAPSAFLLPTGAGQTRIVRNPGFHEYGWGAFLPDGKHIVFSAQAPRAAWRLYLQEIPEGAPRPISPDGVTLAPWTNPVSPDGKFVVGSRQGRRFLYPIGGGDERPISGLSDGGRAIQWTPDGKSLYMYVPADPKVWVVDVGTGERRLWRELRREGLPAYAQLRVTPDGKAYVYRVFRAFSELYVVEGLH